MAVRYALNRGSQRPHTVESCALRWRSYLPLQAHTTRPHHRRLKSDLKRGYLRAWQPYTHAGTGIGLLHALWCVLTADEAGAEAGVYDAEAVERVLARAPVQLVTLLTRTAATPADLDQLRQYLCRCALTRLAPAEPIASRSHLSILICALKGAPLARIARLPKWT
jgi:hypothetical protein